MENALLIGLSRQIALRRELEVVANNIANLNTTGFKADGAVFEEFIDAGRARGNQFAAPTASVSFVQDRATWHDMSQGPIAADRQSARRRDRRQRLPGRCRRRAANATPATARCRSTRTGQLVTSEGYPGARRGRPDQVPAQRPATSPISRDGTISVREGGTPRPSSRGKLRLVDFDNAAAAAEGRRQRPSRRRTASPQPAPTRMPHVVQGAIEKSNVRARRRDDAHDRGHAQLHRRSPPCCSSRATCAARDRAARRSSGLNEIRRIAHASTSHRRDRNDGPGTQRPGHLQQHRQHAHHRLQAPARRIPGPALRARAPRRHADLGPGQHPAGRHRTRLRRQDRRHAAPDDAGRARCRPARNSTSPSAAKASSRSRCRTAAPPIPATARSSSTRRAASSPRRAMSCSPASPSRRTPPSITINAQGQVSVTLPGTTTPTPGRPDRTRDVRQQGRPARHRRQPVSRNAGLRHARRTARPAPTASATCSRASSNRPMSKR